MTETAALELRHVRLAEQVTLRPAPLGPTPEGGGEEGVFIALDDSPPVRTIVAVVEGNRRRALEVAWVVEVTERDEPKGFYGRWVADEALERAARVGTEHLEDGTPVVQPVVHDNSAVLDLSDTAMAMPAPVMIVHDDDTGVIDTDDEDGDGDGDDRREASEASASDEGHVQTHLTVSYPEHPYESQTVSYPEYQYPEESGGAAEQATEQSADQAVEQVAVEQVADQAAESTESTDQAEASDAQDSAEAADAGDEADAAETSTDAGEAPAEASDGDAGSAATKGRKKRGRRKR